MDNQSGVYLDHNATGPATDVVQAAVQEAQCRLVGNPASPHRAGREAAAAVDAARLAVADWAGRDRREVIFTSGATEANALVLQGLRSPERREVVVSSVEHPSVLAHGTWRIPVDSNGLVRCEALEEFLAQNASETAVVSVMAANNETGVVQPLTDVASLCRKFGVPLHTDATQSFGRMDAPSAAQLVTLSAHKGGGPKGVGALITDRTLTPQLVGGPQERGLRAGTLAVPLIVGFGAAARTAGAMDTGVRDALAEACREAGGRVLGESIERLPNTVAALFRVPGDLVVMALDLAGVCASTGSACASGAPGQSHVVEAMGERGIPVRLSHGPQAIDVQWVAKVLQRVVQQVEDACAS